MSFLSAESFILGNFLLTFFLNFWSSHAYQWSLSWLLISCLLYLASSRIWSLCCYSVHFGNASLVCFSQYEFIFHFSAISLLPHSKSDLNFCDYIFYLCFYDFSLFNLFLILVLVLFPSILLHFIVYKFS